MLSKRYKSKTLAALFFQDNLKMKAKITQNTLPRCICKWAALFLAKLEDQKLIF